MTSDEELRLVEEAWRLVKDEWRTAQDWPRGLIISHRRPIRIMGLECYDVGRIIVNRMMADIWQSRVPARRLHGDA